MVEYSAMSDVPNKSSEVRHREVIIRFDKAALISDQEEHMQSCGGIE